MVHEVDGYELLDELDLAILHALQIDARAPWTRIAAAVGADATTVTRHWHELRERSLAWLTSWPTPARWAATTDVAVVLLEPPPAAVLDRIAALPWVLSLDETSAGCLALIASRGGLAALGARTAELAAAGAVVRRMDVAASIAAEDSAWRLRALSPAQQRVVRGSRSTHPADEGTARRTPRPEVVAELADALDADPRLPAAELGSRIGVSEATARRTLEAATASGMLRIGCDLAMPAAGLRRGMILWGGAPDLEGAAARAARLPGVHRVAALVGPAPLFACVRASSLTALPAIERAWGPDVAISDRWTVLRARKRNGHLLDAAGRSIGRVPPHW